jgi:hypothetical protein
MIIIKTNPLNLIGNSQERKKNKYIARIEIWFVITYPTFQYKFIKHIHTQLIEIIKRGINYLGGGPVIKTWD